MYAYEFNNSDRALLHGLHQQALTYAIDNQLDNGLILDRQRNHGRRSYHGLISTSATGMGWMALALASNADHGLLTRAQAIQRIRRGLLTALALPHNHGMLPHFLDADTLEVVGDDAIATIDASWLIAGALWSAEYLADAELRRLAKRLYDRVDWRYWSQPAKNAGGALLLSHGADADGAFLPGIWDRQNAETAFMYVLALGAARKNKALPIASWYALGLFFGSVYDMRCTSGDLGLFVFQYSRELMNLPLFPEFCGTDLRHEWEKPVLANYAASHQLARLYKTFASFWGISAGDGPPEHPGENDTYKAYAPLGAVDGTAHVLATVSSIGVWPGLVLENLRSVENSAWRKARGRYGYSNINIDRNWFSRDVVGIDVGMAVLALENALYQGRVRETFHRLKPVRRALQLLTK
jgi:hypothetical protein